MVEKYGVKGTNTKRTLLLFQGRVWVTTFKAVNSVLTEQNCAAKLYNAILHSTCVPETLVGRVAFRYVPNDNRCVVLSDGPTKWVRNETLPT